jgi:hypothetical protein
MHYYFDGFIWKVRHKQNSEALTTESGSAHSVAKSRENAISWWASGTREKPTRVLLRQMLYFGVPMSILTIGALAMWSSPQANYIAHMYRAQALSQQGLQQEAETQARLAYADMNKQMPLAAKLAELSPTSSSEAELAFLIYNQSLYENLVMPQLAGQRLTPGQQSAHRESIRRAEQVLRSAIDRAGSPAHPGRKALTRDEAMQVAASWRTQL